ncbi:MAG: LacI family transcriptional regulator [Microbacterium sp.]|uniref:LacI family DNA-binding transcriptional regulator n=1 Tax=unclassified Microbacterium TaxID=2609290 RepID=UPI000DAF65F1|nr:LacI family DNA-binding transcriptional regulator [Microbacterium sp.]PZU38226.1 MAG: LacI family transcriptional regulator [Microbacterium sp.]
MATDAVRATPTIEQVAAAAGVSRSTVSRVVNGSSAVSPEALAAVKGAIERLAYVPNRAARSLASRQTHAIALVVPEDASQFFGDPYFAGIVTGISRRISESDYLLNLIIASDDPSNKTASYVRSGTIDGALVASHHAEDRFIDAIAAAVPLVFGGRPAQWSDTHHFVDVDNVAGARLATQHLIERGRTRIATITGPLSMPAGVDRLAGWSAALAEAGLAEGPAEDGGFKPELAEDAMRRILASGREFDALFVASDMMARAAIRVLTAAGIRVPQDVAIVGYDDSPVATDREPQLTTIRQPLEQMGETMASLLIQVLAGTAPAERALIMPTELVVRETT